MTIIELRRPDTGKPFCAAMFGRVFGHSWAWICDTLCREYDCTDDEIDLVETDAGDVVTVRGEAVATIHRRIAGNGS